MNQKERNYGIEGMRILCMLMITAYHVMGYGAVITHPLISQKGLFLCRLLQALCFIAVDGYALISGYVGYRAVYRYSSLVVLWLRAWIYSVAISLIAVLFMPNVNAGSLLQALCPLVTGRYWYFTAYAACFMLMPLARAAVKTLNKEQMGACLMGVLTLYSLIPTVISGDPFALGKGYDGLWLLILYMLGAYISKYRMLENTSGWKMTLVLILCVVTTCAAGYARETLQWMKTGTKSGYGWLLRNDSPTMVMAAVCLLVLCARVKLTRGIRLIAAVSPLCFGVYLLQDHPVSHALLHGSGLYRLAELRTVLIVPSVLLVTVAVFFICAVVDALCRKGLDCLRIPARLRRLEERLIGGLWRE